MISLQSAALDCTRLQAAVIAAASAVPLMPRTARVNGRVELRLDLGRPRQ